MRTLWICLLIAVLPLRLWAGSAMLVQHTPPVPTAAQAAASEHPCHTTLVVVEVPHTHYSDHSPGKTDVGATHPSCNTCDICHTVAHPWVNAWLPLLRAPQPAPVHHARAVANVRLAPAFKPPII